MIVWFGFVCKQNVQGLARADYTYSFTHNIADFCEANDKRLPKNWDEFVTWYNKSHPGAHLRKDELEGWMELKWGMAVRDMDFDSAHPIVRLLSHSRGIDEHDLNRWLMGEIKSISYKTMEKKGPSQ